MCGELRSNEPQILVQASTLALTVEVPNRSACFDANLRLQIYHNKNFRRNSYLNSLDANFYTETITTGLTPSLRELCYISSQKNYMLDHSRNLGMMCRAGTTSMKYILILKYNSENLNPKFGCLDEGSKRHLRTVCAIVCRWMRVLLLAR